MFALLSFELGLSEEANKAQRFIVFHLCAWAQISELLERPFGHCDFKCVNRNIGNVAEYMRKEISGSASSTLYDDVA